MTDRQKYIEEILGYFHAIRHRIFTENKIFYLGNEITYSQWIVLRTIKQKDGISVKDLAAALGVTSSAATQLINGLVQKGYLVREDNIVDRRSQNIRLTENISRKIDEIKLSNLKNISTLFEAVSDEELHTLCEASKKIAGKTLDKE